MTVPGKTFGRVAEDYQRTRPEYPPAAIDRAVAELGLAPDAIVLDLAAGTGKLTRPLRQRFAHVIAVEPDDAMRAYIDGGARPGSAESIPVEDASLDAVFVGDAFHWFDFDAAFTEIARVLRSDGGLALLYNSWGDRDTLPAAVRKEFEDVFERYHGPDPVFPDWRDAAARSLFGPMGEAEYTQTLRLSGRDYADLWLTSSVPASLVHEERRAIAERAYPLMDDEYVVEMPTQVYWMRPA
jgi:SAM-dependent methyltransferase